MKNWLRKEIQRLKQFYPPFGSLHFWAIQVMAILIAAAQFVFKTSGYSTSLQSLYFIPITLLVVPVVYAALTFGFAGSVGTAIWVVVLSIPNLLFGSTGLELFGNIFQLLILVTMSIFMGQRVDRELKARKKIETYTAHVLRVQEEERQLIARELHDETIQNLALLYRHLNGINDAQDAFTPASREQLKEARKIAEKVVTDLRNFTRTLRPPILDDLGMVASVRRLLVDFIDRTKIKGQLKITGVERRLPGDAEVGIFRMAQEALWNVEHHARASNVSVFIIFNPHDVILKVTDDGVGFDVSAVISNPSETSKLGLLGMQERAELAGGKLNIQSSPGKGTSLTITIPK
jgi:two-component system, NarL family, sensor histidine kinase DegS